jgi:hypothetical protein
MRGEWGGKLQWGKWDAPAEVQIVDGMMRADISPGMSYCCEIVQQGKGRVRIELGASKYLGIYRRAGDEYIIYFRPASEGWPTDSRFDSHYNLFTLHRLKTPASDPAELPKDVVVIETPQFAMPIEYSGPEQAKIETTRLFVSEDRGKSWKHMADYKPNDKRANFSAPHDGQYWFALQMVLKDGKCEPPDLDHLSPSLKVYVNSWRRTLKTQKP